MWAEFIDSLIGWREGEMKKIVAIMLVLAALSASVFAGDSYLGLTLAPEFEFGFQDETFYYRGLDITAKKDFSNGYFGIGAEWTNFFGDGGHVGLSIAFTYNIPMYTKAGDITADDTLFDYQLVPKVGLALRFGLTDKMSLEAGAGVLFAMSEGKQTEMGATYSTSQVSFDAYGKLGMIYKFTESWALRAGFDISYTLFASTSYQWTYPSGHSEGDDMPTANPDMSFTPYIGAAFCY